MLIDEVLDYDPLEHPLPRLHQLGTQIVGSGPSSASTNLDHYMHVFLRSSLYFLLIV